MHAIITGGAGMVGGSVLRQLLADSRISKVTALSRRSTGLSDPKLTEVLDCDFSVSDSLVPHMQDADILFHCIATYAHTVDKETYEKVSVTYFENVLIALKQVNPDASVVHFSASGANPKENSWYKALNTKGRAEKVLWASTFPRRITFRPAGIVPTRAENIKGISDKLFKMIFRILPMIGTDSDQLATAVVGFALSGGQDGTILKHPDIVRLLSDK
ncbi:MAG: NAD(P)H-binding protein [Paracoccaceae bacterium]|nr:NAD(P)H-binding protein [Paracoccaceae bacterium]MDG2260104.1 NAD(P)H-binding protein [Paracoccaceae bacterium]